jgi:hypothetical protein
MMHQAINTYEGSGGIAPSFFTPTLDGDKCSALCPSSFNPEERVPGTQGTGTTQGVTVSTSLLVFVKKKSALVLDSGREV